MIKLELSLEQVNVILNALGHQPLVQVLDVFNLIKRQAESQVNTSPVKQCIEKVEV